jgi:uncharacterized protein YbjT (DUF2867 family)
MHDEIEFYLESSALEWTHLRPSQFMQVYLREVPTIAARGAFFLPMEDAQLEPVDLQDVAKVAFALLRSDGHHGKSYNMTGPEGLTMTEIAERISAALGKTIHYVNVSPLEKRNAMAQAGVPSFFLDAIEELFAERRRRRKSKVDLGTHEVFGIRPTTFAEFAQRDAAAFRGESTPS